MKTEIVHSNKKLVPRLTDNFGSVFGSTEETKQHHGVHIKHNWIVGLKNTKYSIIWFLLKNDISSMYFLTKRL
jgi:hypothetical protein